VAIVGASVLAQRGGYAFNVGVNEFMYGIIH
jgi:hypothetical protein